MNNNQSPPQLPPKAPKQVPPQLPPETPHQVPQQQYQPMYNPFIKHKDIPTVLKVIIGIVAFLGIAFIVNAIFGDDKSNNDELADISSAQIDANQKWKVKAIEDSIHINNGYFAASAMYNSETFVKKFHELELLAIQQNPKDVTDSTIIKAGNRNANNAAGMLNDSSTVYRNQFTKVLKDKLWIDNIKVKTTNNGKTLWLIGGLFASNRNIAEFHNGMKSMFTTLGYKRICYKWVDVSSAEYTYYDLDK